MEAIFCNNRATVVQLVALVQKGGPEAADAEARLHLANTGLCRAVVRHLQPLDPNPDEDLVQEAHIALGQAIRRYEISIGASFATFAWAVIKRSVGKAMARKRDRWTPAGREELLGNNVGSPCILGFEEIVAVRDVIRRLPLSGTDREVLWRIYWRDESQAEVAARLGVSHTAVHKRHRRVLAYLRTALRA